MIDRYLALERMMLEADERGDEVFAEEVRDLMDNVWYRLSGQDYAFLDRRARVSLSALYPISVPISQDLYADPASAPRTMMAPNVPQEFSNWRMDAP